MVRPDFREFKANNSYYILHGGPGSGRYPLGSGKKPYQRGEERKRIKKENKQKKKLLRKLNSSATNKEYNMIKKQKYQRYRQEAIEKGKTSGWTLNYAKNMERYHIDNIEESVRVFDSTLEKLKEYGVDLDNIKIKRVRKVRDNGQIITYWTGNRYYMEK